MTSSLVVKRLNRNLRYKKTYVQVYQGYLEPDPGPRVVNLLHGLIEAQKSAIVPLERYLKDLGDKSQDEGLFPKLMSDAVKRRDLKSRMRFLQAGLSKSVSWYKMQLLDQQMTADPRLKSLLFELGEIEAALLWRTEAAMCLLRIPVDPGKKDEEEAPEQPAEDAEAWRSRLVEEMGRPEWGGYSKRPPRPTWRRGTP
jgi:hypothetical protein